MDPLNAANALATIVQLLGVFAQERKGSKDLTHQQFIEWLQYHKHEQLVALICNTTAIQSEVTNLLRQDTAALSAKLDAIASTLAAILGHVQGFGPLALAVAPQSALSEQAIVILRRLVHSHSRFLIFHDGSSSIRLEEGTVVECRDRRFLVDDLATLESSGLLSPEPGGSEYTSLYRITRAGAQFIRALETSSASATAPLRS